MNLLTYAMSVPALSVISMQNRRLVSQHTTLQNLPSNEASDIFMGKLAGLLNKMNLDSKIDRPPAAILGRQLTVVA